MATAYSYIRFSTPEQAKGDSLRRQMERSEKYAAEHRLTLDRTLNLNDRGLSGFTEENRKRGALGVFLKAVEVGIVKPGSYLLVESLDRLSRAKVTSALNLFTGLINAGIKIVTLIDGQVYSQQRVDENWTQLIISISIMARAHEESATKRDRLLEVWGKKLSEARSGTKKLTGMCPAWLELSRDKTSFKVKHEAAVLIQRMFDMILAGHGSSTIEIKFNEERIPHFGRSKHWNRAYIKLVLHNRALIGEFQPRTNVNTDPIDNGEPIKDYYPRIISDEKFYAVQKILTDRAGESIGRKGASAGRKGKLVPNLLSGLCRCGYCGGPMVYAQKTSTKCYLVCSSARRKTSQCTYSSWKYADIEEKLMLVTHELKVEQITGDDTSDITLLNASRGKLDELTTAHDNLIQAIEKAPDLHDTLLPRLRSVKQEISTLKQEVQELEGQIKSGNSPEQQIADLAALREQLGTAKDEDIYKLRLRINSELRQILKVVKFFPKGGDPTRPVDEWGFENRVGKEYRYLAFVFKNGNVRILH